MKNLEKYSPYVLALLRIVAAYMFILHGTAKFWEFPISMTGGNGAVGRSNDDRWWSNRDCRFNPINFRFICSPSGIYPFGSNGLCVFLYARCR